MKNWYRISNKAVGVLDVSIHDEIGLWGVSAKDFIADIAGNYDLINVSINSPGGSVFDGFAMYNALKTSKAKIVTTAMGVAASAASVVFMAGDERIIPEDAYLMIHAPWGGAVGGAGEMRDYADLLDKINDSIINIYAKGTGIDPADLADMVSAETWLNGREALEKGFATSLAAAAKAAAMSRSAAAHFSSVPDAVSVGGSSADVSNIKTISDYESFLRDAGGFSRGLASALTSRAKVAFLSDSERAEAEIINACSLFSLQKVYTND